MTYEKFKTLKDFNAAIWRHYKNADMDYMDGFIHSPTEYVLCIGNLSTRHLTRIVMTG